MLLSDFLCTFYRLLVYKRNILEFFKTFYFNYDVKILKFIFKLAVFPQYSLKKNKIYKSAHQINMLL